VSGPASSDRLAEELEGLDRLDLSLSPAPSRWRRVWSTAWPKVAAIALALVIWQLIVWSGWKPSYVLPGPSKVFPALWDDHHVVGEGALTTLRRAVEFYAIAVVAGTVVALMVSRSRVVRSAIAPLVAGLQTMPSVAWVPFAIIVFGIRTEAPIMFVTLLGTVPAVIIGTLGASGLSRYRYVILPASLPGYVAGLKQAWAFAWRSLMAGELIVNVTGSHSLGQLLSSYQDLSSMPDVIATMLVILFIGLVMDTLVFSRLEQAVLARRGLATAGS
jgi:NitT/TauT family transport system permease protein